MLDLEKNSGFEQEMRISQEKAFDELEHLDKDEHVIDLTEYLNLKGLFTELYDLLRTPFYPKKWNKELVDVVHKSYRQGKTLRIRGVLASPTAVSEVPYFIHVMKTFMKYEVPIESQLLLVQWEQIEASQKVFSETSCSFQVIADHVRECIMEAGLPGEILSVVDISHEKESEMISAPLDFKEWSQRVSLAEQSQNISKDLKTDLNWITGFYQRQESLQSSGRKQALFDLMIRRAIGDRFSKELQQENDESYLMLTSELNKRFLKCYRSKLPIANILVR